jgi:hypothetical protein
VQRVSVGVGLDVVASFTIATQRQACRGDLTDKGWVYTSRVSYGNNDFECLLASLGDAQSRYRYCARFRAAPPERRGNFRIRHGAADQFGKLTLHHGRCPRYVCIDHNYWPNQQKTPTKGRGNL